jgi:hypothetical protein
MVVTKYSSYSSHYSSYSPISSRWPFQLRPFNMADRLSMMSIVASCYHKLKNFSVALWVDSLAMIVQLKQMRDIYVREMIVRLKQMRDIYVREKSVFAWLGPSYESSELAMKWIQDYGGRWAEIETYATGNTEDSSQPMACYIDPELELHLCGTHFPNPYSHAAAENYLPLRTAIDLSEARHRRTTSFHSNMSYSMLGFLDEGDYYLHGAIGHDSALLEPELLARIGLKVTMLSNWWQYILMVHGSVNVGTIPPGSLRIPWHWTTDAWELTRSECNHTFCENWQRKCLIYAV